MLAQTSTAPAFQNIQRTTGSVGLTPGQSARLNVIYATAPAPILQILCSATLNIADDQGKVLKTATVSQLVAGKSAFITVNGDTDVATAHTEVHGFVITPLGCNLVTNLEIIDNASQKTEITVGSQLTYPGPALPSTGGTTPNGASHIVPMPVPPARN